MRVFTPADILLPRAEDMTKWSCIACDQFTAEPEYWQEAERIVGSAPSTLRLMLPEAWLGVRDSAAETRKIYAAMQDYVNRDVFRTVAESFIYVERTLPSGAARTMCARVVPRVRPTIVPRAYMSQCGAPRPVKAETR